MFDKIKAKLFPCEVVNQQLITRHAESVRRNDSAHKELMRACKVDINPTKNDNNDLCFSSIFRTAK